MSTTIDQHVVEMRFDNKHFEKNVATTMSTLDKLKQKFHLPGAAKGLEDVGNAAKKVDMSGLATGVDTVHARFSALQVMGVTALANITNSAVNAGKRMVSALTIDPIKTGFQEYETQMNAVQTILANTQSKGSTLDDVNAALDALNVYADKTIYNFTEMTRNIGTFTAAGVDLETSVNAIQGIANLAAVSGSTSQQASTAMYQLSQALAAGSVKLMDWNSVVNAGMGGEVFQNALRETSELLGTGAEAAIKAEGSFRESLKNGWLTSEVLTATLKKFTTSGANEYVAEYTGLSVEAVQSALDSAKAQYGEADAVSHAAKALAEKSGKNESEIKDALQMAQTAENAATKVKTFTQLWDVMKESAQSGWSQTWKLIVGDFEEAKNLLTPIADFFTGDNGIITKMSNARNKLLESALGKSFSSLSKSLDTILGPAEKVSDAIDSVTGAVGDLDKIVDEVILGKFGNGSERFDKLAEAGWNYYKVQNKVNEKLGDGKRYTKEQIEAQDKLLGSTKKTAEATSGETKETIKLTDEKKNLLKEFASMTEEQAKSKGYTDEQIAAMKELGDTANKLGMPLDEFIDNMDQINGRWLIWNSFKNIGQGIVAVFSSIGKAYRDIFPAMTGDQLFNIIAGFHKLTSYLKVNDATAEKLRRTFKGVFALLDIVTTILGGGLKIAFKAIGQLLGMFDLDILDVTAAIGDAIVGFRDWIDSVLDFTKIFEAIIPVITDVATAIRDWFSEIKDSEIVQNIIAGLVNGLKAGGTMIWNAAVNLGKTLLEAVKNVLGIHSPSTEFFDIAVNCIRGLINGFLSMLSAVKDIGVSIVNAIMDSISGISFESITDGFKSAKDAIGGFLSKVGGKLGEFFGGFDFGTLVATGLSGGTLFTLIKIGKILESLTSPLDGVGDILENAADTVKAFTGVLKSFSASIKAKALKDIAIALAILVGSIAVLTFLPADRLDAAVDVIITLGIVLGALSLLMGKVGKVTEGIGGLVSGLANIAKISAMIIAISSSVLLLAAAVKLLSGASWEDLGKVAALTTGLGALIAALLFINHKFPRRDVDKVGKMILKIGFALLIIAWVAKIAGGMEYDELGKAGLALAGLTVIVSSLILVSKLAGKHVGKIGSTIWRIGFAMLMLVAVAKIIAGMTWEDMGKAGVGILALTGVISLLIATTKLVSDKDLKGLGATLLGIGTAMFLLTMVGKIIADMDWSEMGKAGVGILALSGIITGLIASTKLVGTRELKRVGTTLLMMSIAIGILAGVATMLSLMNVKALAKGLVAVGLLAGMMTAMIWATRGANDCKGNLIVMTIAIAAMATAVLLLSAIDTKQLLGAAAAMSILMGMFALITKFAGTAKGSIGTLVVITLAVGMIAYILYSLAQLPIESTVSSALALSVLLLAISGAVVLLSKFGGSASKALKGVLVITAMAVPLAALVGVLALMQNVQNAAENAKLLGVLAGVLTLMLIPLTVVGAFATQALTGVLALTAMAVPLAAFVGILALMQNIQNASDNVKILAAMMAAMTLLLVPLTVVGAFAIQALSGVLALTTMTVPLLAFVGVLALMEKLQNATENVKLLTVMMGAMTILLVALALVGPMALAGVPAIGALLAIITAIGAFVIGVGALMEKFPQLENFLDRGIPILDKLAHGIGSFVGNLIGGFAEGVVSGLPAIGTHLTEFMTNAQGFIDGVRSVDESVLNGTKHLSQAILTLVAADFLEGIVSFLNGGTSFATLGTELSAFMDNAQGFFNGAKTIDPASLEGVKSLADAILILTKAELIDGLASWFSGGNSLSAFGAELGGLGSNLNAFASNLGGFDESKAATVTSAANAIKSLAQAADAIPNEGGWAAKIFGDNSIVAFGSKLPQLATDLNGFATNLGTFNEAKVATVTCAANAIKAMAQAAELIPNEGGWAAKIAGDNSIATFGVKLPLLGTNLNSFATNLGTFDDAKVATVTCAANAIKAMAQAGESINGQSEWAKKLFGDNSLASFGTQLASVGTNLKDFVTNLGTFDDGKVSTVNSAVKAIKAIAELAKADLKDAKKHIEGFGSKLGTFGTDVATFCTNLPSSDSLNTAASNLKNLITAIKEVAGTDFGALADFGKSLNTLGTDAVKSFVGAFTSTTSKTDVKEAAKKLADKAIEGIEDKESDFDKACKSMASSGADAIDDKYQSFYDAGSDLVDGFAAGISDNDYKAEAKARAMAKAAAQAAEDALDINSPSKVFRKIGTSVPEGFAMGIDKLRSVVVGSSVDMAAVSVDSVKNAIANISTMLTSNMDTQPTIRPVLDLTNVRAGANELGSLFGSPVGTLSAVGTINSMMNRRNQNGTNMEVVSAINKLRKDLSNMDHATYNVNGVTYDDGSAVSEAIKTIVRHAKIERRV